MTQDQAREKAMTQVFVYMTRGDIEDACHLRGIKRTANRSFMEKKLIDAMTEEFVSGERPTSDG